MSIQHSSISEITGSLKAIIHLFLMATKPQLLAPPLRLTQCMPNDKATAFALILEAKISGRRRAGTGPAPSEKDNT